MISYKKFGQLKNYPEFHVIAICIYWLLIISYVSVIINITKRNYHCHWIAVGTL